jgi:hypothetical protein
MVLQPHKVLSHAFKYSCSDWPGRAKHPTREPEAHGVCCGASVQSIKVRNAVACKCSNTATLLLASMTEALSRFEQSSAGDKLLWIRRADGSRDNQDLDVTLEHRPPGGAHWHCPNHTALPSCASHNR